MVKITEFYWSVILNNYIYYIFSATSDTQMHHPHIGKYNDRDYQSLWLKSYNSKKVGLNFAFINFVLLILHLLNVKKNYVGGGCWPLGWTCPPSYDLLAASKKLKSRAALVLNNLGTEQL